MKKQGTLQCGTSMGQSDIGVLQGEPPPLLFRLKEKKWMGQLNSKYDC